METPVTVYLRKRDPDQPFWKWVAVNDDQPIPAPLRFLVADDSVLCGVEGARRAPDYLTAAGFSEAERGTARMPVEAVDYDGNPVLLSDLAPAA